MQPRARHIAAECSKECTYESWKGDTGSKLSLYVATCCTVVLFYTRAFLVYAPHAIFLFLTSQHHLGIRFRAFCRTLQSSLLPLNSRTHAPSLPHTRALCACPAWHRIGTGMRSTKDLLDPNLQWQSSRGSGRRRSSEYATKLIGQKWKHGRKGGQRQNCRYRSASTTAGGGCPGTRWFKGTGGSSGKRWGNCGPAAAALTKEQSRAPALQSSQICTLHAASAAQCFIRLSCRPSAGLIQGCLNGGGT